MVDPVSVQQVAQTTGGDLSKPDVSAEKSPDKGDVEKFEAALGKEDPQQGAPPETTAPEKIAPEAKVAGTDETNMGDSILKGIENLRESHKSKADEINSILDKKEGEVLSMQDTMRLQMEFMQLNLQQEMTTKVADKTGQGVQTLFKNQ